MPGVGLDIWNEQLSAEPSAAPAPSRRIDAYTQPIAPVPIGPVPVGPVPIGPVPIGQVGPIRPPRVHFSQPEAPQSYHNQAMAPQAFQGPSTMALQAQAQQAHPAMALHTPSAMRPGPIVGLGSAEIKGDLGNSSNGDSWKRNDIWISLGLVFIIVLLIIVVVQLSQLSKLNKLLSKKFL